MYFNESYFAFPFFHILSAAERGAREHILQVCRTTPDIGEWGNTDLSPQVNWVIATAA